MEKGERNSGNFAGQGLGRTREEQLYSVIDLGKLTKKEGRRVSQCDSNQSRILPRATLRMREVWSGTGQYWNRLYYINYTYDKCVLLIGIVVQ